METESKPEASPTSGRGRSDHRLMSEPAAEGTCSTWGMTRSDNQRAAEKVKQMTRSISPIDHVPYEKAYGPGFEDMRRRCPNIEKIRNLIDLSRSTTSKP